MTTNTKPDASNAERHRIAVDEPYILFLIGARLNGLAAFARPRKLRMLNKSMRAMQAELLANPDLGCVRIENWFGRSTLSVQYWRSTEDLMAYARNPDAEHLPAWREFNRRISADPAFGIWHEVHEAAKGHGFYANFEPFGLGQAARELAARSHAHRAVGDAGSDR